ncbi:DUF192 domain-containing protein [Salisaeta longa]|uniref:DUF192 domain-containing protein n=1 Tax=Salisaeta longa TaxID=503170 RepID=UPI00040CEA13|nr:DUF192 domain-containing protein [Salisaeta longa]
MVRLMLAAFFSGVLFALSGCTPDAEPTGDAATGFTAEGRLAFLAPQGDTLTTIAIEIADTPDTRARGLMRRRSLGYNRGMLFIYDVPDTNGMWMKNTPLPLDIIFVNEQKEVINIARRTTPFSETPIRPDQPALYVVEVRAGFAKRFGITSDTRLQWTRTS